jgi:hypothetical protein
LLFWRRRSFHRFWTCPSIHRACARHSGTTPRYNSRSGRHSRTTPRYNSPSVNHSRTGRILSLFSPLSDVSAPVPECPTAGRVYRGAVALGKQLPQHLQTLNLPQIL